MRGFTRLSQTIAVVLAAALAGCDGDDGLNTPEEPPDDTPAGIGVVSGISQSGIVGTQLDEPLVAKVVNRLGQPLAGVTVNWVVEAGGGAFGIEVSSTDQGGLAQTTYTLGDTPGENSMLAVVTGTSLSARFLAMALPEPTTAPLASGVRAATSTARPTYHHLHVRYSPTVQGEKVPLSLFTGAFQLGSTNPGKGPDALIANTPGGSRCSSVIPSYASPV